MTTSVVLFSKDEAKRETAALKKALIRLANDMGAVMVRLHEADERELWRASGYRSMAAYVTGALGMSRSNAYRVLDQMRASLALNAGEVSRSGTESEQLEVPTQRDAADLRAEFKQKRPKRGMPDKTSVINAISTALDSFDFKAEGYEAEEIMAYMTHDERRALERAVGKAGTFAEVWGDLLRRRGYWARSGPVR